MVQEQVLTTHFACDLSGCKGACCTLKGGAGAPILETEIHDVRVAVEVVQPYLSERSKALLQDCDPVEGPQGDRSIICIDDADCVFVFYENEIAKCAIEKAYFNGEIDFRKPLSCHLFPIRVANFGGPYLHYEAIDECEPGRELGRSLGKPLIESLQDALTRAYGPEMYERLRAASTGQIGDNA